MAYSYKGSISFGLVYIPVKLHLSVKQKDISFNFIDKNTMSRIRYKKTCLDCDGKEVKTEDIVKGYEYEDGKYVIVDNKDFESIKSKRDKTITIEQFVKISEIDPVFYEKSYYVVPTGAEKAYSLLLAAMEATSMAGIAKAVLGTKDTLIVIRVKNGQMLLNTLFFDNEIMSNPAKDLDKAKSGKELDLAVSLINSMSGAFEPQEYKDEYREKLVALIESKISGKKLDLPKEADQANIINLMDALKASIENAEGKPPKSKPAAKIQGGTKTATKKTAVKSKTAAKTTAKKTASR